MFSPMKAMFPQRKKLSLTSLLIGLVTLVVVLTSTILLAGSYVSKKNSLIETTLRLNYNNASGKAQTLNSLFISMRESLQYSANSLTDVEGMTAKQLADYLNLMRNSSNFFNSLYRIDENGQIRGISPYNPQRIGGHLTTKYALDALLSQRPYISSPYVTPNSHRLIVFMSQPLFDQNSNYTGFVGGSLYLQEDNILSSIFGNNSVDDSGSYYYIVDAHGRVLYHPDKQVIGSDLAQEEVVQSLLEGKSGCQLTVDHLGRQMIAGYSYVDSNGWGVVAVSPLERIQKELMDNLYTQILVSSLPFMILLIGVILIARQLARPFVYLADLMSKLGKERVVLPEAKSHWNREADLLTKAVFLAVADIQKQQDQLAQDAATDGLTGLLNRRSLEQMMQQWLEAGTSFSLILLDVDRFKPINDTYGHLVGDRVLKHVSDKVLSNVRPTDACFRFGGEEFIVLLPDCAKEEAFELAEIIRKDIESSAAPIPSRITISLGVAHCPDDAASAEQLLHKADQAMYLAKSQGRNRTMLAK
ncbi:sensor domain-containing diguanylate cyclase [Paenibacillus massiliensis]|uniref:sensor domain-containing diguanylate cyclase n=1 Tax=Paenibacillus massiliensis TaxID=225917 RepID=UPI000470D28F|nr:sensor domain-containing diguanylate cyclase [Paenibacillus massiliensis]